MRLDGVRHGEEARQRQARVRETRMNALTDGPDPVFAGQSGEGLHRIIGHHVVELAHQSLVRPEHDRADEPRIGSSFAFHDRRGQRAFPEADAQSQLHACDSSRRARAPTCSYWPMLEAAMAFIVRTTDCRSPALSILRRRLAVVSLTTAPWASGFGCFGLASVWLPAWIRAAAQARFWLRFSVTLDCGLYSGLG